MLARDPVKAQETGRWSSAVQRAALDGWGSMFRFCMIYVVMSVCRVGPLFDNPPEVFGKAPDPITRRLVCSSRNEADPSATRGRLLCPSPWLGPQVRNLEQVEYHLQVAAEDAALEDR